RRNANIPACARAANPGGCKPLQGDAPERIVLQGLEGSRPAPPLATDTLPQVGAGAGNVNTRRYASLDWPLKTLLDLHLGAGVLELLPERVGVGLGDAFLDRLGRAVDQVLGLLETETGGRADDLDRLDLLLAGRDQHDGEFGLLLGR